MAEYLCPQCGAFASASGCTVCGRGHEPLLDELETLDSELAANQRHHADLEEQLRSSSQLRAQLNQQRRGVLAALQVRAKELRGQAKTADEVPLEPQATSQPPSDAATLRPQPIGPPPPPQAGPTAAPEATSQARPETSRLSVQNTLLGIGGIVSAIAVIIFTAVTWNSVGLTGRIIILSTITAILLAIPLWLRRRQLNATAETIASLGLLMVGCDVIAAGGGGSTVALHDVMGFVALLVSLAATSYQLLTRMRVPGWTSAALAALAIPLFWVNDSVNLALSGLIALAIVTLVGGVAYRSASAGSTALTDRVVPHLAIGIGVVALVSAPVHTAIELVPRQAMLVAAISAAVVVIVAARLPRALQLGASWTALAVFVISACWVTVPTIYGTFSSLVATTTHVWHGAAPAQEHWLWPAIPAAAVLGLAALASKWSTARVASCVWAFTVAILAIPPATGMSWRLSATLLAAAAAVMLFSALKTSVDGALYATGVLAANAIGLALGSPVTTAAVAAELMIATALGAVVALRRKRYSLAGGLAGLASWTALSGLLAGLHHLAIPVEVVAADGLLAAGAILAVLALWWTRIPQARRITSGWAAMSLTSLLGVSLACGTAAIVAVQLVSDLRATPALLIPVAAILPALLAILTAVAGPSSAIADRTAAGFGLVTLATGMAALVTIWIDDYGLLIHVVLALLTVAVARVSAQPHRISGFIAAGVIGGVSGVVAAVPALLTASATIGLTTQWTSSSWLGWQVPVALLMIAMGAPLLQWHRRGNISALAASFAIISLPAGIAMSWWVPAVVAVAGCAILALWSVLTPILSNAIVRYALAGALAVYAIAASLSHSAQPNAHSRVQLAAWLTIAVTVTAISAAVVGYFHQRKLGGSATAVAIAVAPLATLFMSRSLELSNPTTQLTVMSASVLGLFAAGILRMYKHAYLAWATFAVPIVATACAFVDLGTKTTPIYFALATLLGVSSALLMLPDKTKILIRSALAAPILLINSVIAFPMVASAIFWPYSWVSAIWTRSPSSTIDGLAPHASTPAGTSWQLAALTVSLLALVLLSIGLVGSRRILAVGAAGLSLCGPCVPVILDSPWPALPITTLALAVVNYVIVTRAQLAAGARALLAILAAILAGSAISGALPTRTSTVVVLSVLTMVTVFAGVVGRGRAHRIVGWSLATGFAVSVAMAAGFAAQLPRQQTALAVMVVAVALWAVAITGSRLTRGSGYTAEFGGCAAATVAALLAAYSLPQLAIVLLITAAVMGLYAVRVGFHARSRKVQLAGNIGGYAGTAIALAALAYWLLLWQGKVATIEWYTLPFAILTLIAGWFALRRRPRLGSWLAFGPGLLVAGVPTAAAILIEADSPLRRICLGVAALAVLLIGSAKGWQAPVMLGGGMILALAIHEVILLWIIVPFWMPLAIAGALLLIIGASFEQRRRDFRHLRRTIRQMQ